MCRVVSRSTKAVKTGLPAWNTAGVSVVPAVIYAGLFLVLGSHDGHMTVIQSPKCRHLRGNAALEVCGANSLRCAVPFSLTSTEEPDSSKFPMPWTGKGFGKLGLSA